MEIPKIPDSIGTKLFYFPFKIYKKDWELVKKESSGKYTILKSIFKISDSEIFECEINQNDIKKMHKKLPKNKNTEYNPPIFLRIIEEKKYYPYIISVPSTDFTNDQKRIIGFFYEYKLENLSGFHPFTKDKSPPFYYNIEETKKNCFAKFYQLFKNDIKPNVFDSYFTKLFSINDYNSKKTLNDFPFLFSFLESKFKNNIIDPVLEEIILAFKYFSWNEKYYWKSYFPEAIADFYNDYIKPLFLGNTDKFKQLYSNIKEESQNIIDMLFITYDFEVDNYKYYNDESLLSSCLTTLEKKQKFYELYYELLLTDNYFRPDFKYKKYFREEFTKKAFNKYLQYESDTKSWKKFDFAGEDKYSTSEGGGGCYFYKEYHVRSNSFRKTKKGQLLNIDHDIIKMGKTFIRTEKHFYLNEKIINLPLQGIKSTFSYDENNIIVTDGGDKPYIYNIIKDKRNDDIIFDNFSDKCYDAIMLENKLIVVSGYNMFGYYCQFEQNYYKIIHSYKPEFEDKQKILIYLIEFNDNLLISCYKIIEKEKNSKDEEKEENRININEIYLGFHKINYNKEEKKLNDENILKSYTDIKLSEECGTFKNILSKFSDTILGIGGDTNIYLINIQDHTLVKTISEFKNEKFCSFYIGDFNVIFVLTRYFRDVRTYNDEFKVYSTSIYSYRFDEKSISLVNQPMPKGKNKGCIVF